MVVSFIVYFEFTDAKIGVIVGSHLGVLEKRYCTVCRLYTTSNGFFLLLHCNEVSAADSFRVRALCSRVVSDGGPDRAGETGICSLTYFRHCALSPVQLWYYALKHALVRSHACPVCLSVCWHAYDCMQACKHARMHVYMCICVSFPCICRVRGLRGNMDTPYVLFVSSISNLGT